MTAEDCGHHSSLRVFCLSLLLVPALGPSLQHYLVDAGDYQSAILAGSRSSGRGVVFCLNTMVTYRLIVRCWPLPNGDNVEESLT